VTRRRTAAFFWLLLLSGCANEEGTLVVDLVTDLRPGVEVTASALTVFAGPDRATALHVGVSRALGPGDDLLGGQRIGEVDGVPYGPHLVRVELLGPDAEPLVEGLALVDLDGPAEAVTIRITRDCVGVTCPGDGSPTALACLGGECVEPSCTPDTPELCPAPECEADADCPGDGCLQGSCEAGVCFARPDDLRCDGRICAPDGSCVGPTLRVGAYGACVHDTSEVRCWGRVGGVNRATPMPIAGLTAPFTQLDVGLGHACAAADGQLFCWGRGTDGQLGDGADRDSPVPVAVPGLPAPVTLVSAGTVSTCAAAGGELFCWGTDLVGVLGNGAAGDQPEPGRVTLSMEDASRVRTIDTWGDKSFVALSDGRALGWGHNDEGVSLGVADVERGASQDPIPLVATDVLAVRTAGYVACALGRDRAVACWGDTSRGARLGDGTEVGGNVPVQPTGLDGGVSALSASAVRDGADSVCVVQRGAVRCFGDNELGQLGGGPSPPRLTPTDVEGLPAPAVDVAVGEGFACATLLDQTVWCWGGGGLGQLGDGLEADSDVPVRVAWP